MIKIIMNEVWHNTIRKKGPERIRRTNEKMYAKTSFFVTFIQTTIRNLI